MNRILLGFAACVIVAAPLEAQTRPLSYDDYYRIGRASATALSPNGRNVAFVRSRVLEEENRSHSEVWMVGTGGTSEPIRLTSPATEADNPRWSPDAPAPAGPELTEEEQRIVDRFDRQGYLPDPTDPYAPGARESPLVVSDRVRAGRLHPDALRAR